MPLDRECELRGLLHAKRLDHAIGRARLDGQSCTQVAYTLPVQGIDANAVGAGETFVPSSDSVSESAAAILHLANAKLADKPSTKEGG